MNCTTKYVFIDIFTTLYRQCIQLPYKLTKVGPLYLTQHSQILARNTKWFSKMTTLITSLCICEASYFSRTSRCLQKQIKEHQPAWLGNTSWIDASSSSLIRLIEINLEFDTLKSVYSHLKVATMDPKPIQPLNKNVPTTVSLIKYAYPS